MMTQWIADYLEAQKRAVDSVKPAEIAALVETLRVAWSQDQQIFAIGNGGSAANASHFAVDLGKGSSGKNGVLKLVVVPPPALPPAAIYTPYP